MSANTGILLGYGGGASIDGEWVFLTSGSLSRSKNIPLIQPYGMPDNNEKRFQVCLSKGHYSFSGSINFDLTNKSLKLLNSFTKRNYEFEIILHDGNKGYKYKKCKMDSFSISSSPLSLVTGTLSFQSTNDGMEDIESYDTEPPNVFTDDNKLVKYWNSGNTDIESFTLNVSQSITPVYLNTGKAVPAYIRAGAISITLNITCWKEWLEHKYIKIGSKTFTIKTGTTESQEFNYGGQNETGQHTYTFKAYNEKNSGEELFTIT